MNIKRFNVREAVNKVIDIQKMKANAKGIELNATFESIAKDNSRSLIQQSPIIWQDEERFKQVLLNIQSNALKFTREGSVVIKVDINTVMDDKILSVSVIDTGIGIKESDLELLF